jgi:hypothetical protein
MKLIRLTDDRYILDCGKEARASDVERIREHWADWWTAHPGGPATSFVIGGSSEPIEYEDRRDPDAVQMARIEEKLDRIWEALS